MTLLKKSFTVALGLVCLVAFGGGGTAYAQLPWQTNQEDSAPDFREDAVSPSPLTSPAPQQPSGMPMPLPTAQAQTGAAVNPLGVGAELPGSGRGNLFSPPTPEEIQQQMEQEAEQQKTRLRELAFDNALESLMPLTPEEIRTMLDVFKVNREAAEQPVVIPNPKTYVGNVSLDPSAEPLVIEMSAGYVTTLTVVDMTGAPWPIQDVSWAGEFDILPPEPGGNVVRITPMTAHGRGNISMRLAELRTPITLTLNTQLEIVHYRFDARIPRSGPLAEIPIVEKGGIETTASAEELVQFMDGYVPENAASMMVSGTDGRTRAWLTSEGQMVLRTPMTLLSPSWDSSIASGDGTRVYSLKETPVVLLSENGRMVQAHFSTGAKADE